MMNRFVRSSGRRLVSIVVAGLLGLAQGVPAAAASTLLRPGAADTGADSGVRRDEAWLYGAAGEQAHRLRGSFVDLGREFAGTAFTEKRAFPLVGPGARPVDELLDEYALSFAQRYGTEQTADARARIKANVERVKAGLERTLEGITVAVNVPGVTDPVPATEVVRFSVILDETGLPSLIPEDISGASVGHQALVAFGGQHRYQGWDTIATAHISPAQRAQIGARNIYLSYAVVEGLLAYGTDSGFQIDMLRKLLRHEIGDAMRGEHLDEPKSVENEINIAIRGVIVDYQQGQTNRWSENRERRIAAAKKQRDRMETRVQLVPYRLNLGRFFEGGKAPDYVIDDLRERLTEVKRDKRITDFRLRRFGAKVALQVTYNGPQRDPAIDRLVVDLATISLGVKPTGGAKVVKRTQAYDDEIVDHSYADQVKALRLGAHGEFAFHERSAEPIYVSMALNGGPAAFNWAVIKLLKEAVENQLKIEGLDAKNLADLQEQYQAYLEAVQLSDADLVRDLERNATNLAREAELEGPGYVVQVESVHDIRAGKRDRRVYRFAFPNHGAYIMALVNDQTEWVITKVLPRPGGRMYDTSRSPEDQDPVLTVVVDDTEDGDPTLIGRAQSGAPAVGEFVSATTNFYVTTAGADGNYHRGVMPVTEAEADQGAFEKDGMVRMVSYSYQSHDHGHIPPGGARDQVALSHDVELIREDPKWIHDMLVLHGTFQPHATAPHAIAVGEATAKELGPRFHEVPAVVETNPDGSPKLGQDQKAITKLDPILKASNEQAVLTCSDLKADIGGEPGHQLPADVYFATLRASLREAQEQGLIVGFEVKSSGDDMHMLIFHKKGVDSAEIHTLAWESFFRSGWVLKKVGYPDLEGYQPYGFMQDLVSPEVQKVIKEGKLESFAKLSDRFIELLAEEIQEYPEEAVHMGNIQKAYDDFKTAKSGGTVIELPFSGNVRGQGIGFAEMTILPGEEGLWSVIASDKTGPGAYNRRVYWSTRLALLAVRTATPGMTFDQWLKELAPRIVREEVDRQLPDVAEDLRMWFTESLIKEIGAEVTTDATVILDRLRADQRHLNEQIAKEKIRKEDLLPSERELIDASAELQPLVERERTQRAGLLENDLSTRFANGLIYEIWDVKANTRIFLDAEADNAQILKLLSAVNDYNVKRIWLKKKSGWIGDLTTSELRTINLPVLDRRRELGKAIAERKRQLYEAVELRHEKAVDQLTPWERQILEENPDRLTDAVVEQQQRFVQAQHFLGDSYILSASTEKLAVAGGGAYLGKDDPTAWAIESLARFYRAFTRAAPTITLGDARGSHWVAIRPEDTRNSVAVSWSNSVENAYRFTIGDGGTLTIDDTTHRVVMEDMYSGADYVPAQQTAARFNKIWIDTQGGFTPHGPNKEDVESAYPYTLTLAWLTAEGSPFARQIHDASPLAIERGMLAKSFPHASDFSLSQEVAVQAADLSSPRWVVIHSSVLQESLDAPIVLERIQEQLRTVVGSGRSGLRFALVVDGAEFDAGNAEWKAQRLLEAISEASHGLARLSRSGFDLVVPAQGRAPVDDLLGLLEATSPGSELGSVVGPIFWTQAVKAEAPDPDAVAAIAVDSTNMVDKAAAGGNAIRLGVEAAVAGGVVPEALVSELRVLDDLGVYMPQAMTIEPAMEAVVNSYRATIQTVQERV